MTTILSGQNSESNDSGRRDAEIPVESFSALELFFHATR